MSLIFVYFDVDLVYINYLILIKMRKVADKMARDGFENFVTRQYKKIYPHF